jgi:hypothetical protein
MQLNPRSAVFLVGLASALALHGTHAQAPGAMRPLVVQWSVECLRLTTLPAEPSTRGVIAPPFLLCHQPVWRSDPSP